MNISPGDDLKWCGQIVRVVDIEDRKLHIARPINGGITLVVATNGQLVWVNTNDLKPIDA
jgi:hypothetical protein